MPKKSKAAPKHGVELIERVIEHVAEHGFAFSDAASIAKPEPVPESSIEAMRFPNGQRPSPSLARWLRFDGSWLTGLGWFRKGTHVPRACTIGAFAAQQYGDQWSGLFAAVGAPMAGDFYLLPLGADSRRALFVGRPDSTGEHPIVVTDNDDVPYVALMYPGFDVYMAHLAGLVPFSFGNYEALHKHRDYRERMAEHRANNLAGRSHLAM